MPQSPRRKKARPSLPKHIRDELRMTCAIRALDYLKKSGPKTLIHQAREVYDFFHGKEPTRPSQILLLSKGMGVYSSLYEIHQLPALRDNDSVITTKRLRLKEELSLDLASPYFSELDINSKDLEKKNKTGLLLITGRTILNMAAKGLREYKKALSFAKMK